VKRFQDPIQLYKLYNVERDGKVVMNGVQARI